MDLNSYSNQLITNLAVWPWPLFSFLFYLCMRHCVALCVFGGSLWSFPRVVATHLLAPSLRLPLFTCLHFSRSTVRFLILEALVTLGLTTVSSLFSFFLHSSYLLLSATSSQTNRFSVATARLHLVFTSSVFSLSFNFFDTSKSSVASLPSLDQFTHFTISKSFTLFLSLSDQCLSKKLKMITSNQKWPVFESFERSIVVEADGDC